MTSLSTSSADLFSPEEVEEMRFLSDMKGELRDAITVIQDREGLTQNQTARRLGYDPAYLSRVLSPDRHNNSSSLFHVMYRSGRRWKITSEGLEEAQADRMQAIGQGQAGLGYVKSHQITPTSPALSIQVGDAVRWVFVEVDGLKVFEKVA